MRSDRARLPDMDEVWSTAQQDLFQLQQEISLILKNG